VSKILMVDDEVLISLMVEERLSELGHTVIGPASCVASALPLCEEADCALLDLTIRGGSSYPIAEALSERGVPFAFATGHSDWQLDDRFKSAPVLAKPFGCNELRDVIDKMLSAKRNRPSVGD
jgi:DNA-binding NtrC family response regulator